MGNLKSMDILILGENYIEELPPSTCKLPLSVLAMEVKKLKHLPKEIGDFKHILQLSFSNNQLDSLPNELCYVNNSGIQSLFLVNNKLTSLPDSIHLLRPFDRFEIGYNYLTNVTDREKEWLDKYDVDWAETQKTVSIKPMLSNNRTNQTFTVTNGNIYIRHNLSQHYYTLSIYNLMGRKLLRSFYKNQSIIPLKKEFYNKPLIIQVRSKGQSDTKKVTLTK